MGAQNRGGSKYFSSLCVFADTEEYFYFGFILLESFHFYFSKENLFWQRINDQLRGNCLISGWSELNLSKNWGRVVYLFIYF